MMVCLIYNDFVDEYGEEAADKWNAAKEFVAQSFFSL